MDAIERYEKQAREFYQDTGLMAPGKDAPAAMGGGDSIEKRRDAWYEWLDNRTEAQND